MKFDSNRAWKQASQAISANRDLVLALAGVFFFLPSFAIIMLVQQPPVPPGATPEQMLKLLEPFVAAMAPLFIVGSVVQALGQLTVIELLGRGGTDSGTGAAQGVTVREALRRGLRSLPSFIAVQLLTGFIMMALLVLAMAIGGLISPVLGLALGVYVIIQAYARIMTAPAVIVLEGKRSPFTALARALAISRGNGFRLGNFLFLLAMAALFVLTVLSVLVGIVAALTIGEGRVADIVAGFVSSGTSAVALAYFVAIVVAVHGQLREGAAKPFV